MELAVNNNDVLTEILVRLPAKSLTRFKSVCKKWLSLISSDYFCHIHTLRHPKLQLSRILQTHICEFYYWNPTTYGEQSMIPYSLSAPVSNCTVVHACNGLMLLKLKRCDEPLKDGYYVYNPTTRRSRMISLTHSDEFPHVALMNLAFDPSNSPYYKIVCFKTNVDPFDSFRIPNQIEVYDSESRTWKLALQSTMNAPRPFSYGTLWNNAIYWSDFDEDDDYRDSYCYFDIDKNEMKTLSSPHPLVAGADTFNCSPRLVELNGHLYHIERCIQDGETGAEMSQLLVVWELDHHSQWRLKHNHTLISPVWVTQYTTFEELIGGTGSTGGAVYNILTFGTSRVYSFLDKSYHDFRSQPVYWPDREWFEISCHQFGETLVLV